MISAAQKKAKDNFKKAIAYRKKTGCDLKAAFAHVYGRKVGAVNKKATPKKKAVKKAAPKKKAAKKLTNAKDKIIVPGKVMNGIFVLTTEEKNFLQKESKESKGYKYRAKILFGSPIVLKETENGTPIKKWEVDNFVKAQNLSNELNKNKNLRKIKKGKI